MQQQPSQGSAADAFSASLAFDAAEDAAARRPRASAFDCKSGSRASKRKAGHSPARTLKRR